MAGENIRYYGFGEFSLDARRRILLKNNETVALSPRNFDLLLVLIENEGRILTHDDLLDKVWEGTFVEQANLKNAISVLRRVLGEQPNEALYIRTVPRRGYSFVAPIQAVADESQTETVTFEATEQELVVEEFWTEESDGQLPPNTSQPQFISRTENSKQSRFLTRYKYPISAAGVLIAIAAVFASRVFFSEDKAIRYDANSVTISKITTDGNLIGGDASISPNGKYLVYAARVGEGVSLWTRQIATGISRQISPAMKGSVWACVLTTDEEFIYYVFNSNTDKTKSGLYKISTFGGSAQQISNNGAGSLSMSPDGKRLATRRVTPEMLTNIETMNLDGTDVRVVWSMTGDVRIWDLKYSTDGSTIIYSVRKTLADKSVYYIGEMPVDGGTERIVIPEQEKQIADAVWLPDKKSLLLSVRELNAELRQIWQYFVDTKEWRRVTNDNASYRGISLTKDGKTLVASQESRLTSLWASATGSAADITQVLPGTHYLIDVGWTTDARIVYSGIENSKELVGILNADGSGNRFLTTGEDGIWLFPNPSLDGKHIAFASLRSGRRQIWAIDNDGRNARQLSQFETDVYDGRLLSDGVTAILQQLVANQKVSLVLRRADGSLKTIIENQTRRWAVSPDEKEVASMVEDLQTHTFHVRVVNIETGEIMKIFNIEPSRVLRWTPDGKALAWDMIDPAGGKVMLQPLDGGSPKEFINLPAEDAFSFDWSPDNRRFALIRGKHLTDAVKITIGNDR